MAGFFAERGAELWTTRTAWLQAQVLRQEDRLSPCREQIDFIRRAGLDGFPWLHIVRRGRRRAIATWSILTLFPIAESNRETTLR